MELANFDIEKTRFIFDKLETFCDSSEVKKWENSVKETIDFFFKKYRICSYNLNKKSYMGIVIDCTSKSGKHFFLKMVPPMINRFSNEIETLKRLPKKLTCKIYEIDYEKNTFIMEKIIPGKRAHFDNNKNAYSDLFKVLNENKIKIDKFIEKKFKSFDEVVTRDYKILLSINQDHHNAKILYSYFIKKYSKLTKNEECFLLHGDVYKNNVLTSNKGLKIIDPLGFKAPFVMELVSIWAYALYENQEQNENKKILNEFIEFFSPFVDPNTYSDALFCQLIKVFIPSLFEANDGGIRANKWLTIIKDLYPEIKPKLNT